MDDSDLNNENKSATNYNRKTHSFENIQFLNAAYTTRPSYSNQKSPRDKNFGNFSSLSRLGTSPRHNISSSVVSTPNLMESSNQSHSASSSIELPASMSLLTNSRPGVNNSNNSSQLHVNGSGDERPVSRNSGGDFILQLQQENEALRRELDLKESKLQSNMNSIKTFWSPELKKERTLRKEEGLRTSTMKEQLKVVHEENQHCQLTMQALQDELRAQRDLNQLLQDDFGRHDTSSGFSGMGSLVGDGRFLQEDNDRMMRENELLQRTMEEMEVRIEAQRQTLDTRDESVRKLLEMLQCKGISKSDELSLSSGVEMDALKVQIADYESKLSHQDMLLNEKNRDIQRIKQQQILHNNENYDEPSKIKAIQNLVDMKESKIISLERVIRDLEDEMNALKHEQEMSSSERGEDIKQLEVYKNHSNFMKAKIEQLKSDVQKRETEMVATQTRLDTLNNQQSDSRQHIDVLKESLTAKEQRAAILQTEVDSLRSRLDEKQVILDQKQDQLLCLQEERSSSGCEMTHLRDTLEVKDRKVTVLHKKIESLAEVIREKDRQSERIRDKLHALEQDSTTSDSALTTMEEALTEKDKLIEKLRTEQADTEENYRMDFNDLMMTKQDLEKELDHIQTDISEKEGSLSDLKEHASSLASSNLKKDSKIKQLEITSQQRMEECLRLETLLKKTEEDNEISTQKQATNLAKFKEEWNEKIEALEKSLKIKEQEVSKSQGELDRLLEILKETENEKHNKDKKITTLDKQNRDLGSQIKSLNKQIVEEVKKKGVAHDKNMDQLLRQMKSKDVRVEELEEALRESVSITAEREHVLSREEEQRHKVEKQMVQVMEELQQLKVVLSQTGGKLASTEANLQEKERIIQQLKTERRKQLEEAFEVKQEALLALISEKDANIALLELSQSRKKTNAEEVCLLRREKDELMKQLKQQTQSRLKLMQETYDDPAPPPRSQQSPRPNPNSPRNQKRNLDNGNLRNRGSKNNLTEDDAEGIWA